MARSNKPSVSVGAPVRFCHEGRELTGIVARADRRQVFVLGDDRRSYQVLRNQLLPLVEEQPLVPPPTVELPVNDHADLQFNVDDRVLFRHRQQTVTGRIARLNPKRALVVCDNRDEYQVPYELLTRDGRSSSAAGGVPNDSALLDAIETQAVALLRRHGLAKWRFAFDDATRRAGSCQYGRRTITLSRHLARNAPPQEILDTLLHEIAHALVGPQHHHDAVWRAKALAIGGSGQRCHTLRFAPPRYIVQCRNGCWSGTAERRRRNVVCRQCRGEITYQTFTQERWEELKKETGGP